MKDWTTSLDVRAAFANQVSYCRANDALLTGRIVEAVLAGIDGPRSPEQSAFLKAVREWPGRPVADALPLRCAGGLHALHLSGGAPELAALYAGDAEAMADAEVLIADAIARHDAALLSWLDGPPQTNEAGRSANYAAALLWLQAQGLPRRFECIEIGSSAGINLMMDRYRYDLGGVTVGPPDAAMTIVPEWRGSLPPMGEPIFESLRGCDVAPVDLTEPAALLRLKAYVWPEHAVRFARLTAAADAARASPPDLVEADAADFVETAVAAPQPDGTTRVLMHSIVWQYVGAEGQARITAAMAAAGARATAERPLAWIALEANRETFQHELVVRFWSGLGSGDGAPHLLARAHAHGAWVEWLA